MKKGFLSVIAASALLVNVANALDKKVENVSNNAVINAKKEVKNNSHLVKQAISAIGYTNKALVYLEQNDVKKAKSVIKKAIGELADVLNAKNAPYLLPIDFKMEAYEFVSDIKEIEQIKSEIKKMINKNKLIQARRLLNRLRNEIEVKTINLPVATYPAALSLSLKYLNENKISEAKDILSMALSTLVNVETIIPISLLKAQTLVYEAKEVLKKDKNQALKYLIEAQYQLKLSKALGYTSSSDTTYKNLDDIINDLQNKITNGDKTSSIFDNLLSKLKEFKDKAINTFNK